MLRELKHIQQKAGEPPRRWFEDGYFDLIVWYEEDQSIWGFQLCYDRYGDPHALTWRKDQGFSHHGIDSGHAYIQRDRTPILVGGGSFPYQEVREQFEGSCRTLDSSLAVFILEKLAAYAHLMGSGRVRR